MSRECACGAPESNRCEICGAATCAEHHRRHVETWNDLTKTRSAIRRSACASCATRASVIVQDAIEQFERMRPDLTRVMYRSLVERQGRRLVAALEPEFPDAIVLTEKWSRGRLWRSAENPPPPEAVHRSGPRRLERTQRVWKVIDGVLVRNRHRCDLLLSEQGLWWWGRAIGKDSVQTVEALNWSRTLPRDMWNLKVSGAERPVMDELVDLARRVDAWERTDLDLRAVTLESA